jgi:hypothetical protein
MLSDEEIGARIRALELEEEYVRELIASLGFDPAAGFTLECIEAMEHATLVQRRAAALRTLALAEGEEAV